MLKYLTKIAMDIFPSVIATIIGAYIVNHYINAKPADAPVAAAVAPAVAKKPDAGKAEGKPLDDVANLPAPGVTARGISERPAVERAETRPIEAKPAETKPAETASVPSEPRRHVPTLREKVMAKISPAPAPAVAAPPVAAPVETATPAAPEEHKDAADLARAAIERLRNMPEGTPRAQDARSQETARETARAAAQPALRPLPPPITVSTPGSETYGAAPANPPYTGAVHHAQDRPIPPADIPAAQPAPPVDLRADASSATRERPTVADDVLSAAKSMFNAVLPKSVAD